MKALGGDIASLIESGRLCPWQLFVPQPTVNSPVSSGDGYVPEALEQWVKVAYIPEVYRKHCSGKKAIVFCTSVDHAEQVAAEFTSAGYPAAAVLGTQNKAERTANLERFRSGDLLVLTTVHALLDEHMPEADAVILAAPTSSKLRLRQQSIVAMKPRFPAHMPTLTSDQRVAAIAASDKPTAMILDIAGNFLRLGPDL